MESCSVTKTKTSLFLYPIDPPPLTYVYMYINGALYTIGTAGLQLV